MFIGHEEQVDPAKEGIPAPMMNQNLSNKPRAGYPLNTFLHCMHG